MRDGWKHRGVWAQSNRCSTGPPGKIRWWKKSPLSLNPKPPWSLHVGKAPALWDQHTQSILNEYLKEGISQPPFGTKPYVQDFHLFFL